MLVETYRRLRHSLVAFVPRFPRDAEEAKIFPTIFGSGFVAHEDGLIATNAHVIDVIQRLPRPDDFSGWPATAMLFILTEQGMAQIQLVIEGVSLISQFAPGGPAYYGPRKPDLGFVHVAARGLLPVKLRLHGGMYEEGEEIATAGFPMGRDHLTVPGWMHQISPTLQAGIVSAVHPFPCTTPHGFTMSVMVQGEAGGSPIFNRESGEVLGAVYAGVFNYEIGADEKPQRIPTNYTYGVAAHYIVNSLPVVLGSEVSAHVRATAKSIRQLFSELAATNVITGERIESVSLPW